MSQWAMVKLGELISKASVKKAGDSNLPILSMTMHEGLVLQSSRFDKRIASNSTANYRVVNKNQLVVGFPIDEGVLDIQTLADEAIVSPVYKIWSIKDTDEILPEFLRLYLRSDRALAFYSLKLRGTTARRRSLPDDIFLSMPVMLPPIEEQRRIAQILTRVSSDISKANQQIALLDKICRTPLFVNPSRSSTKLTEYIRTISSGKSVQDTSEATSGNKILKISAVTSGFFKGNETKYLPVEYSPKESHAVTCGDLLVSRANTSEMIGSSALVDQDESNVYLPDKLWKLSPAEGVSKYAIWHLLQLPTIRKRMSQVATGSSGSMKNISQRSFLNLEVPQLSFSEISDITETVKRILSTRKLLLKKLTLLEELHRSLATRAFAGQL